MFVRFFCLLMMVSVLFSCKRDASYSSNAPLKFVNASVNAPKLDVFVDGSLLATQVAFPSVSNTFFVPLGATPTFRIAAYDGTQAGMFFGTISNASLKETDNYSLIATDSINKLKVSFVNDSLDAPEVGKAKVRFFQLCADYADTANIYIDTFKIATARLFNDQANNYLLHKFYTLNSGTYIVRLKTNNGNVKDSLINVNLASQKIYTIILKGSSKVTVGTAAEKFGFTVLNYN